MLTRAEAQSMIRACCANIMLNGRKVPLYEHIAPESALNTTSIVIMPEVKATARTSETFSAFNTAQIVQDYIYHIGIYVPRSKQSEQAVADAESDLDSIIDAVVGHVITDYRLDYVSNEIYSGPAPAGSVATAYLEIKARGDL